MSMRRLLFPVSLTLGLVTLDYFLFALPPVMGISFGDPLVPWGTFAILRTGLLISLVLFILLVKKRSILHLGQCLYWGVHILLIMAILDGFYLEPQILTVSPVRIETSALPAGSSLRVVQLSDLHVERTTQREKQIPTLVESLQPDIIVLTGDYVNLSYLDDPRAIADARSLLAQLHAPSGVFAVNGTVDSRAQMDRLFTGLDIHVLFNESVSVPVGSGLVQVIGLYDEAGWVYSRTLAALQNIMRSQNPDQFQLLLYHNPDLMESFELTGVDLYLAGHTHGGQVRLPFYGALITYSAFEKKYEMGRYDVNGTTLYVSRGLGLEGSYAPRVRFFCPPEIVVIEIIGTGAGQMP